MDDVVVDGVRIVDHTGPVHLIRLSRVVKNETHRVRTGRPVVAGDRTIQRTFDLPIARAAELNQSRRIHIR